MSDKLSSTWPEAFSPLPSGQTLTTPELQRMRAQEIPLTPMDWAEFVREGDGLTPEETAGWLAETEWPPEFPQD